MFPRSTGLAVVLLVLGACSPRFNWRELRVDGTLLVALMPCKADTATRPVPLGGTPTELHMFSCENEGLRFAVAWADVGPADQAAALNAWRNASLQALHVPAAAAQTSQGRWPAKVAGASTVQGVLAQGTDPRGQAVQTRAVYFTQGSQVFQAAVYGPRLPDEVTDAFFGGLQLAAP